MAEGVYSVRGRAQMPTVSGPNWGTIITGMNPEETGIDSNSWTPLSGAPDQPNAAGIPPANAVDKVPEIPWVLPESMWRAAKKQNKDIKTAVAFNWAWIGFFMDDAVDMHFRGNDNAVGAAMCDYIENEKPELMFIHFDEVDGAGHDSGWGSTRYYDQIANVDRLIGDVIDSLEKAGIIDDTLVMVSSDHGGNNFGHGGFTQVEMYIPVIFYGVGLQSHGVQNRRILSNRDLAPTALYALGLREGDYMTGRTATEIFEEQD